MKTHRSSLAVFLFFVAVILAGGAAPVPILAMSPEVRAQDDGGAAPTILLAPGRNRIAPALASLPPGGTLILQAGRHSESGTVVITKTVNLLGAPGATLEVVTAPATRYPLQIEPAIHVRGASRTRIEGITLVPRRHGGVAVLVDGSEAVVVRGNRIFDHQLGVVVRSGAGAAISNNAIVVDRGHRIGAAREAHGVVIMNGERSRVERNTISGGTYGIWAGDHGGTVGGNVILGSVAGVALGKVPFGRFLIAGSVRGSENAANDWTVSGNLSTGNLYGYILQDGANRIEMADNLGTASGLYDVELACGPARYGFVTLGSFHSWAAAEGARELVNKGCGEDPVVVGRALSRTPDAGAWGRVPGPIASSADEPDRR